VSAPRNGRPRVLTADEVTFFRVTEVAADGRVTRTAHFVIRETRAATHCPGDDLATTCADETHDGNFLAGTTARSKRAVVAGRLRCATT
jgi:hypothetical protein